MGKARTSRKLNLMAETNVAIEHRQKRSLLDWTSQFRQIVNDNVVAPMKQEFHFYREPPELEDLATALEAIDDILKDNNPLAVDVKIPFRFVPVIKLVITTTRKQIATQLEKDKAKTSDTKLID